VTVGSFGSISTHHTGTGWVLESINSSTLRLRSTNGFFKDFGFIAPESCTGDGSGGSATMVNLHRSAFAPGTFLDATFCAEGSNILVTVVNVSDPLTASTTTQFRCIKVASDANVCQRVF
jgi:hypothetical protein